MEQVKAERDALLLELQDSRGHTTGEPAHMQMAQQQLREQQQSVQLLQAEVEDAWKQLEALKPLEEQVEQLRTERDAALTALQQAASKRETPGRKESDAERKHADTRRERLKKQRAALRRERQAARDQLEELQAFKALLLSQVREVRPQPSHPAEQPSPAAETSPAKRHPEESWYVTYRDAAGKTRRARGTTEEIRGWFQQGLLVGARDMGISEGRNGPFAPINSYPEFQDVSLSPPAAETEPEEEAAPPPSVRKTPPAVNLRSLPDLSPDRPLEEDEESAARSRSRPRPTAERARPGVYRADPGDTAPVTEPTSSSTADLIKVGLIGLIALVTALLFWNYLPR
jgi:hypothetical protein